MPVDFAIYASIVKVWYFYWLFSDCNYHRFYILCTLLIITRLIILFVCTQLFAVIKYHISFLTCLLYTSDAADE